MIPRATYSAPLESYLRRRRWLLRFEALTMILIVMFLAFGAVVGGHSILITLLNLTSPGLPPDCC